ncbi:NAD(P)H-hydrate dehydratase, partial [archaeon]|nr:NAD(P)H-hydrate dehydratase [archaeon]
MAYLIKETELKKLFKKRKSNSHKGENGKVLVIAGSDEFSGAPVLVAMSALACMRTGVDLCHVLTPEKTGFVVNTYSPDLIVHKAKGNKLTKKHLKKALELEKKVDSIVIGPGLGRDKATMSFVREVVKKTRKPIVIDADAIHACKGLKFNGAVILTPHEKEFEIFSGKKLSKNLKVKSSFVKKIALKHKCIILLKGKTDIISDDKKIVLNKTGNPGMTVGGTGDVLAGLCAGFSALGLNLFDAAKSAAFVNGKI